LFLKKHKKKNSDDMPAHIKCALTQTSIGIPFENGRLLLGTWQGVYVWEHRHRSVSFFVVQFSLYDI
jgi:secondary thiamine-phosphate synthase enzyme